MQGWGEQDGGGREADTCSGGGGLRVPAGTWSRPGMEAGCWIGGGPEGRHARLRASPQPLLASPSCISYSGTVLSWICWKPRTRDSTAGSKHLVMEFPEQVWARECALLGRWWDDWLGWRPALPLSSLGRPHIGSQLWKKKKEGTWLTPHLASLELSS